VRVAFLGPRGTFTDDALAQAVGEAEVELAPASSIFAAIGAVSSGDADRAFVPFENSIEGAVRSTLDTLAFDATGVAIVGEHDYPVRHCLIAREEVGLEAIEGVVSHPQASAQCARFIRDDLADVPVMPAASTAEAVKLVAEDAGRTLAALGSASAAELYGCVVLRDGIEDEPDNVTRFVWVAPEGTEPSGDGEWRTTLIFSELGEDHPGALVDALAEFSERGVNLTRIESRPLRRGLGRYMFFVDLQGGAAEAAVAESIEGLRTKAESVRVLGSYPVGGRPGIPGG
jgi:prephenate dehydratase